MSQGLRPLSSVKEFLDLRRLHRFRLVITNTHAPGDDFQDIHPFPPLCRWWEYYPMCLEEVNRTELIIKDIEREIKRMLKDIPRAEYRLSIPGIGPISAAVILGELGNPS
jgi:hypothetical protein